MCQLVRNMISFQWVEFWIFFGSLQTTELLGAKTADLEVWIHLEFSWAIDTTSIYLSTKTSL